VLDSDSRADLICLSSPSSLTSESKEMKRYWKETVQAISVGRISSSTTDIGMISRNGHILLCPQAKRQ
jgi:hypothetical protein